MSWAVQMLRLRGVAELADLVARGELEVPIAGVFALEDVARVPAVELRHTRGKWC